MLKLCCCVFDALIKKSNFICIINATEKERREGKPALKRSKKYKVSFLLCLPVPREMATMYLPFPQRG